MELKFLSLCFTGSAIANLAGLQLSFLCRPLQQYASLPPLLVPVYPWQSRRKNIWYSSPGGRPLNTSTALRMNCRFIYFTYSSPSSAKVLLLHTGYQLMFLYLLSAERRPRPAHLAQRETHCLQALLTWSLPPSLSCLCTQELLLFKTLDASLRATSYLI